MMDRLKVLRLHLAMHAHFSTNYDIFKYQGHVKNATMETLNASKSRMHLINRLATRFKTPSEIVGYIFPQWLYSGGSTLFDVMAAEENYERWQNFKPSATYNIMSDLADVDLANLNALTLLKAINRKEIRIESVVALESLVPFISDEDYLGYTKTARIIKKSTRFIAFNKQKVKDELGLYETT